VQPILTKIPRAGTLLLSEPFMLDENFKRSVILLCETRVDGAIGFVVNKKLDISLQEAIEDFPEFDAPIYLGGPVQVDTLHFIHNLGDLIEGSIKISNRLYWGGNFEMVQMLIQNKMVSPDNFRFFIGYSGWGPGQLEKEVEENSWIMVDGLADDLLRLHQTDNALWQKIMRDAGGRYSIMSNFPENPVLN